MHKVIDKKDAQTMSADGKIGLLATIDEAGAPHISFITSLQPYGESGLTMGEFCEGLSKKFMQERNKVGVLFFSTAMEIWRGRAYYDHSMKSGPEYESYNRKPLFRYNAYFGINTIHYFALEGISSKEVTSKGAIALGALQTRIVAPFFASSAIGALNRVSADMFGQIDALKFISYLDAEGFPSIIPVIQAVNAGRDRIVFTFGSYREELRQIPPQAPVAVLLVNLKMESVLVKGVYRRAGISGISAGRVDIERVYNSMPPQPGYIFPRKLKYEKVRQFMV